MEGATPLFWTLVRQRGGGDGAPVGSHHLPLPVGGSLPPPAPLSCGAPARRARGGHARRSLASLFRMGRGKSVLSRVPCGVSEKSRTPTARAPPSEREALWLSKSCPVQVANPTLVKWTPIRRHRRHPQRRKLSIIPRPGSGQDRSGGGPLVQVWRRRWVRSRCWGSQATAKTSTARPAWRSLSQSCR